MSKFITVRDLLAALPLDILVGQRGLSRPVRSVEIHRPGLALAGFLQHYPAERVQVMGRTEFAYLSSLSEAEQRARVGALCTYEDTPCIVVTRDLQPPR